MSELGTLASYQIMVWARLLVNIRTSTCYLYRIFVAGAPSSAQSAQLQSTGGCPSSLAFVL